MSEGPHRSYYVCPRTGLLRVAPRQPSHLRQAKPVASDPSRRRVLSEDRELHRLGEDWFMVSMAPIPRSDEERLACRDCVVRAPPQRPAAWDRTAPEHWRAGRFAVTKRQLSKREVKTYGLRLAAA